MTVTEDVEIWRTSTPRTSRQSPEAELRSEHTLMRAVLASVETEAQRLARGASLRTEFWADVIDFIGNFVHLCHRAKEERCCFDTVRDEASRAVLDALAKEHKKAEALTFELCGAIESGDWEQTLRLAHVYLHAMRGHMDREESDVFPLLAARFLEAPASEEALRESFADVEEAVLPAGRRAHYVEISRRLAVMTKTS
ncbi:MAG: hemerythrin domain-containing protein [Deltaproteobacteria bacterium]|nr:hemerythrin domain-containing protein [Deltaproteobacteria bacterium]